MRYCLDSHTTQGNETIIIMLDTGAEVTAISEQTYLQLGKQKLLKSDKVLYKPARQTLDVLGKCTTTIKYQQRAMQFSLSGVFKVTYLGLPVLTVSTKAGKISTSNS